MLEIKIVQIDEVYGVSCVTCGRDGHPFLYVCAYSEAKGWVVFQENRGYCAKCFLEEAFKEEGEAYEARLSN